MSSEVQTLLSALDCTRACGARGQLGASISKLVCYYIVCNSIHSYHTFVSSILVLQTTVYNRCRVVLVHLGILSCIFPGR